MGVGLAVATYSLMPRFAQRRKQFADPRVRAGVRHARGSILRTVHGNQAIDRCASNAVDLRKAQDQRRANERPEFFFTRVGNIRLAQGVADSRGDGPGRIHEGSIEVKQHGGGSNHHCRILA